MMKFLMLITICLSVCSDGVNGISVDELEEAVLDQFTEAYTRIIAIEKKHNDFVKKNSEEQALQIQQLISKDEENSRQIELLKQQVEELLKINAPESCHQLSKQGEGIDGKRELVDPDGKNIGFKPIEVSTFFFDLRTSRSIFLFFLKNFGHHKFLKRFKLHLNRIFDIFTNYFVKAPPL